MLKKKSTNSKELKKLVNIDFSYPDVNDENIQLKLYKKSEFYNYKDNLRTIEEKDFPAERNRICNKGFEFKNHQMLLPNILSPNTNYDGLLIFHGLGSGKCVDGNTIIFHDGKFKKIKDVENTDTSVTISYDTERRKIQTISRVAKLHKEKGIFYMKKIVLNNGLFIKCSMNHKLFINNKGWESDITPGDIVKLLEYEDKDHDTEMTRCLLNNMFPFLETKSNKKKT